MIHFFEKFKLPTILGLGIILIGISSGLFLVLREQILISRASPDITPIKDSVTFTNIEDSTVVVSWQTANPAASFVTYGKSDPGEQTALDDRDSGSPNSHIVHYVTLKNLLPKTEYQLKIATGKVSSDIFRFKTASPATTQSNFGPVIGSVLENDKPIPEGVAYLSISDTTVQSSLIKDLGSFLIPLSRIRPPDDETIAKLTVIAKTGQSIALFRIKAAGTSLPVLKIGQNLDLTTTQSPTKEVPPSTSDLKIFDLNSDGQINSTDYAIVLRNFGKNPKEKKADLNNDGVVDKKDLDEIASKINEPLITP
ncbi:fibronectin type III domain-containing protein [Candidatus Daviesbacteria bacterium]|nr:fibronectin type III domain-containing protein [Candidatus Daviesbacteria bacterium]